jgi:hypothetical protein
VSFDPATNQSALTYFQQKYQLPASAVLFGPYDGKLGNAGDSLRLEVPDKIQGRDNVNEGHVPYYVQEQIDYLSIPPWPAASANRLSLQRKDVFHYGNEPTNWFSALPTPMKANTGGAVDHDNDGLPDDWELAYGLDYLDPSDAGIDSDGDGLSNFQEFLCGTNPRNAQSALRLKSATFNITGTVLQLDTAPGLTYTLQYRSSLANGSWQTLQQISASSSGGPVSVTDTTPDAQGQRFYRVLVP